MTGKRTLVAIILLFVSITAHAKLVTAYVSFDTPEGWRCDRASGVFVCQSTLEPEKKEAVVLSIATMATEWDTLENFEEFLKKPRTIQDDEGGTIESKVTYARRRNINGFTWIDSLQLNSELPGFWSRYLATIHKTPAAKVAILITYVVSEERYSAMAPHFERMVSSLKPNAEFDLNTPSKQGNEVPGSQILGPQGDTKDILRDRLNVKKKTTPVAETSSESPIVAIVVVVGMAAAIVILLRRRRKKPKARSSTDT